LVDAVEVAAALLEVALAAVPALPAFLAPVANDLPTVDSHEAAEFVPQGGAHHSRLRRSGVVGKRRPSIPE
jgi:hypothetical protein